MDESELMKMLDLKPKEAAAAKTTNREKAAEEKQGINPTELVLDEYDLEQGERLQLSDKYAMSDFFGAAYKNDVRFQEGIGNKRRRDFLKALLESGEYQGLRTSTTLNRLASDVAALHLAEQYKKLLEDDKRRQKDDPKKQRMACLRAVARANKEASKEIEELEETVYALSPGLQPGSTTDNLETSKIASVFNQVKNNPKLRMIIDRAGRFRRYAQAQQRQKVKHGYEDMIGICLDDTIDRLLIEELACLFVPELKADTLRRLSEKETLAHEYQNIEKVGKGPIIACIDESGSMSGEPEYRAKGFALTMAWIARYQKRWCVLIGFSAGTQASICVLQPNKWDQERLMQWLTHFFCGGTTADVPCSALPNTYWNNCISNGMPRGKTDLIIVTDGEVNIPQTMEDSFIEWKKKEKVRCLGLMLQPGKGGLARVADEFHNMRSLDTGDPGIQNCLSI